MSNRLQDKINWIKCFVLGRARDVKDPHLFHKLSLVAFFAWVGLGADGITSSCYGPEEAFLALQGHIFLGIFVAIGTVETYHDKGQDGKQSQQSFDETSKTAVILVNGFNGMGLHTLFSVVRHFGGTFKNFVFMEAGIIDAGSFKGTDAIEALKEKIRTDLLRYEYYMRNQGFFVTTYSAVGAHVIEEICAMARKIYEKYPSGIFFGGQIVFSEESYLDKFLYNHVTFAVQRRLHQEGMPFMIMPVRVG